MSAPNFDLAGFVAALLRSAKARGIDMKTLAAQTGVSETAISRMRNEGCRPDAASLAALSAWAGINPARYSPQPQRRPAVDRLDRVKLRQEPKT